MRSRPGYPSPMMSTSVGGLRLEFSSDPADFLTAAGEHLKADPVISTVVTTIAHRVLAQQAEGIARAGPHWWLVVRDGSGTVVGAGMRTATSPPYPPFLLPMPDEAAVVLARTLHERREEVLGINGALPAVELCADELARIRGGSVATELHTRLHELGVLRPPAHAPGRLTAATEADVELATEWFGAFMHEADKQAGRPRGSHAHETPTPDEMLRRLRADQLWFWVDDSGEPVHLTGTNPPAFGVARIGPVYTPPAQRGRGWASNAVAEISRRLVGDGSRVCLFTDQANPTSNKIYAALGYRPIVDMANLVIIP